MLHVYSIYSIYYMYIVGSTGSKEVNTKLMCFFPCFSFHGRFGCMRNADIYSQIAVTQSVTNDLR